MSNLILSSLQKDILKFFGRHPFTRGNFYWTDGTLLSYYYFKHRFSADLDFFSNDLFSDDEYLSLLNNLKRDLKINKVTLTLEHNRRLYLIRRQQDSIKLELVFFPFSALETRKRLREFALAIDSLTDIMTNKTLSTYQRNEVKDVYDLYYYLSHRPKYNLTKLTRLVEKKFGVAIEPVLLIAKINELAEGLGVLKPFIYHEPRNLVPKVKNFFQKIFNSLAKRKIK